MKKLVLSLILLGACAVPAAVTVKFAKTEVSVKESAAYAELTVNKTGKEATRVRFATVCGTAQPGREYYATNGVLEWAANKTAAQKIRIPLMPDVVPVWEEDKVFSVALHAVEEAGLAADEVVAEVATPTATVTVTESSKKNAGTIEVQGYYDAYDEFCGFDNPKKPTLTLSKNGDGGLAALSLVRTDGANGAVRVTVTAAQGTAKLGTDFTMGDDPDVLTKDQTVEWADGELGEKVVWIAAVDDEGYSGVYAKACTLKLASKKEGEYEKAKLAASSVSVTLRDANVSETEADLNKRIKERGVSLSAKDWFLTWDGTVLSSTPIAGKKTKTFTVKCQGPGFFTTAGSIDEGEGEFTWTCGKLSGWADDDVQLVVPSGSSTIKFAYASRATAEADVVSIGSFAEEDLPFTWISFADVAPTPCDKAVVAAADAVRLNWEVPAAANDWVDDAGLHYRVRFAASKADLDKAPLFVTNTVDTTLALPEGLVEMGKSYFWRVDYLCGDDGADDQNVAVSKTVWTFTVAPEATPKVVACSAVDVYGEPATNEVVTLHRGVKVAWTLGVDGGEAAPKLSVLSGKLPKGLKLAQDSKTKEWQLVGVPTEIGTFRVTIGGKIGKMDCESIDYQFEVDDMGLAIGNFTAIVADEGNVVEMASRRLAQVTFTAAATGKLSAKVMLGGMTYTFSDTGYGTCAKMRSSTDEDVTADEADDMLTAVLTKVEKIGGVAYTNELEISVRDARLDNLDALGVAAGTVTLRLCVPSEDGKSAVTDADGAGVPFVGALYRDNTSVPACAAAVAGFAGYYTVALVPEPADSEDAPAGNGYLTVTVDAKGKAKVAGQLADGTSVSTTVTGGFEGLLADWAGSLTHRLVLPVFSATKTRVFGGELALERQSEMAAGTALVDSDSLLVWSDDSAKAMYDTQAEEWGGFSLTLSPAGGWYDKVSNLQAYYCRKALTVTPDGGEEEFAVALENDKVVIDKASGVTLKLARATGLLTGTAMLTDAFTGQTAKANHAGVLLSSYQLDTVEGLWSLGYALVSRKVGSATVKVSRPFCVAEEEIDPDFAAGDEGEWTGSEVGNRE